MNCASCKIHLSDGYYCKQKHVQCSDCNLQADNRCIICKDFTFFVDFLNRNQKEHDLTRVIFEFGDQFPQCSQQMLGAGDVNDRLGGYKTKRTTRHYHSTPRDDKRKDCGIVAKKSAELVKSAEVLYTAIDYMVKDKDPSSRRASKCPKEIKSHSTKTNSYEKTEGNAGVMQQVESEYDRQCSNPLSESKVYVDHEGNSKDSKQKKALKKVGVEAGEETQVLTQQFRSKNQTFFEAGMTQLVFVQTTSDAHDVEQGDSEERGRRRSRKKHLDRVVSCLIGDYREFGVKEEENEGDIVAKPEYQNGELKHEKSEKHSRYGHNKKYLSQVVATCVGGCNEIDFESDGNKGAVSAKSKNRRRESEHGGSVRSGRTKNRTGKVVDPCFYCCCEKSDLETQGDEEKRISKSKEKRNRLSRKENRDNKSDRKEVEEIVRKPIQITMQCDKGQSPTASSNKEEGENHNSKILDKSIYQLKGEEQKNLYGYKDVVPARKTSSIVSETPTVVYTEVLYKRNKEKKLKKSKRSDKSDSVRTSNDSAKNVSIEIEPSRQVVTYKKKPHKSKGYKSKLKYSGRHERKYTSNSNESVTEMIYPIKVESVARKSTMSQTTQTAEGYLGQYVYVRKCDKCSDNGKYLSQTIKEPSRPGPNSWTIFDEIQLNERPACSLPPVHFENFEFTDRQLECPDANCKKELTFLQCVKHLCCKHRVPKAFILSRTHMNFYIDLNALPAEGSTITTIFLLKDRIHGMSGRFANIMPLVVMCAWFIDDVFDGINKYTVDKARNQFLMVWFCGFVCPFLPITVSYTVCTSMEQVRTVHTIYTSGLRDIFKSQNVREIYHEKECLIIPICLVQDITQEGNELLELQVYLH